MISVNTMLNFYKSNMFNMKAIFKITLTIKLLILQLGLLMWSILKMKIVVTLKKK